MERHDPNGGPPDQRNWILIARVAGFGTSRVLHAAEYHAFDAKKWPILQNQNVDMGGQLRQKLCTFCGCYPRARARPSGIGRRAVERHILWAGWRRTARLYRCRFKSL